MHVDGRPKKVCTVSRDEPCLMYETRLSRMIMQLPLAQMANRDGDAGMETVLYIIPNELDNGYLMLPPGVLHMSALGRFGRFTLFSPCVSHSKHLPCSFCFMLCFGFGVVVALLCFCFLFCKCFGIPNSPRSLDLDDRQGLIASSAMQQKKKRWSSSPPTTAQWQQWHHSPRLGRLSPFPHRSTLQWHPAMAPSNGTQQWHSPKVGSHPPPQP